MPSRETCACADIGFDSRARGCAGRRRESRSEECFAWNGLGEAGLVACQAPLWSPRPSPRLSSIRRDNDNRLCSIDVARSRGAGTGLEHAHNPSRYSCQTTLPSHIPSPRLRTQALGDPDPRCQARDGCPDPRAWDNSSKPPTPDAGEAAKGRW